MFYIFNFLLAFCGQFISISCIDLHLLFLGHFIFIISLIRFLWNASIFFSIFVVNIHDVILPRNMKVVCAINIKHFRLTLFDVHVAFLL